MSSTLGDLLREVAEPGPNRNSFHSTAHFPSGIARARARGRMEDKIRSRILPNVNSAAIGALSRRAGPQKRDHGRAGRKSASQPSQWRVFESRWQLRSGGTRCEAVSGLRSKAG
jgi:hypothetical protein